MLHLLISTLVHLMRSSWLATMEELAFVCTHLEVLAPRFLIASINRTIVRDLFTSPEKISLVLLHLFVVQCLRANWSSSWPFHLHLSLIQFNQNKLSWRQSYWVNQQFTYCMIIVFQFILILIVLVLWAKCHQVLSTPILFECLFLYGHTLEELTIANQLVRHSLVYDLMIQCPLYSCLTVRLLMLSAISVPRAYLHVEAAWVVIEHQANGTHLKGEQRATSHRACLWWLCNRIQLVSIYSGQRFVSQITGPAVTNHVSHAEVLHICIVNQLTKDLLVFRQLWLLLLRLGI